MFRQLSAAFFVLLLALGPARAETAQQIDWESLVPPAPPLQHPLAHLSNDHRVELEMLYIIRRRAERGMISEVDPSYEEGVELTHKLTQDGLDVEALLLQVADLQREIDIRNNAVVSDLDEQLVRIPGYALPLEFSEGGVDEFLLVPYVGACIHVPPPPPNQMIYVQLNQSYVADSLYEPVWITGRLKVQHASKSLSFVDGQSQVEAGYTLEGLKIEPYLEN